MCTFSINRKSAVAVVALACTLVSCTFAPTPTATPEPTYAPRAIFIEKPIVPPDVPMIDLNGKPAKLSDLRGKYVFVTISNIDCAEACVDGPALFQRVKQVLGARGDVLYLMIGTDINADSPHAMKIYLAKFDPAFTGFTSERGPMRELVVRFGIHSFIRNDGALAPHAPFTYLLDKQGRLVYFFQDGLTAMQVAEAAKKVIRE